ncbi:MAG: PIN domain-containing protein [Streptosporangiaceae bacterium]
MAIIKVSYACLSTSSAFSWDRSPDEPVESLGSERGIITKVEVDVTLKRAVRVERGPAAAFKLLAAEEHADAFLAFYREHRSDNWISSDLLRIEVSRAVARNWPALIPDAQRLLDAFEYVQMDEDVVRSAIVEPDRLLRSLDATHLATARLLGPELTALLTYDDRLAKAAADADIPVLAPQDT